MRQNDTSAERGQKWSALPESSRKTLPFQGIRIIDCSQIAQGPATTQFFADYGADVIKVERVGSGSWERSFAPGNAWRKGESFLFQAFNRNKRSIALDLKSEEGREIFLELVRGADIVIENFRPGVMDRLGLGYDTLSEANPGIICLSASAYGARGPYVARPGQDLLVQALTGLATSTGRRDQPPTPAGAPVVDLHSASLNALALCAALFQRMIDGRGQKIESSLTEAAVHLQSEGVFLHANGWDTSTRSAAGLGHPYSTPPYGIYETTDGYIALSNTPLSSYARVLGLSELSDVDEAEGLRRRDEIRRMIEPVIRTRTTEEWMETLLAEDIWCGPVYDHGAMEEDPHIQSMELFYSIEHETVGEVRHLRPPFSLSGVESEHLPRKRPPLLGEHTDEVLSEIGIGPERIADLRDRGVVQ